MDWSDCRKAERASKFLMSVAHLSPHHSHPIMASLLRKAQSAALQEPEASSSSILEAKGGKRKATSDEGDGSTSMRRNKQRVLLIPSRGVTSQMRHLVSDLEALMPQSKKGECREGMATVVDD